jgi:hypothetical protein
MNQHRPPASSQYDDDFYAWTQHQAKLLRALEKLGHDLPPEIDLSHVAEEIEDLGKSELRGAMSLIQQIMIHLIKAASDPDGKAGGHWRTESKVFHAELLRYFEPSMRRRVPLQKLWVQAVDIADSALRDHGAALLPGIVETCPLSLQDFVAEQFQFEEALARVRAAASRQA